MIRIIQNKCIACAVRFLFALIAVTPLHAMHEKDWSNYIDLSIDKTTYYLYNQVMHSDLKNQHSRALNLGAGSGNLDFDLASKGWDVTSVDTSPRSGEIINKRIQYINGRSHFQQASFENAQLTGDYDLVFSFFALPFGDKNSLPYLIKNISKHMKSGAQLAVNFFGNEHTFVQKGVAYGMTEDELSNLLLLNGFQIRYFLNRHYEQPDSSGALVYWDLLDVIAVKS